MFFHLSFYYNVAVGAAFYTMRTVGVISGYDAAALSLLLPLSRDLLTLGSTNNSWFLGNKPNTIFATWSSGAMENEKEFSIAAYLLSEIFCEKEALLPRDGEAEDRRMLAGKCELVLLVGLTGNNPNKFLPGRKDGKFFYTGASGKRNDYRVVTETHFTKCEVRYPRLRGRFFPPTIGDVQANTGTSKSPCFSNSRSLSLLQLYRNVRPHLDSEEDAVRHIAEKAKINCDPFLPLEIDGRTYWHTREMDAGTPELLVASGVYEFKNQDGFVLFYVTRYAEGESKQLIPTTRWSKGSDHGPKLTLLGEQLYPLMHLDLLSKNQTASVILTDSIEIAALNQRKLSEEDAANVAWTAWYGEQRAIPNVQWDALQGRHVCYFLAEHSGYGLRKVYEIAMKAYAELKLVGEITLDFFDDASGKNMSCDEFETKAKADFGLELPGKAIKTAGQIAGLKFSIGSASGKAKPGKYLLPRFIKEKTLTLLYSDTHVGKTCFALDTAFSVATGTEAFNGKLGLGPGDQPRRVVYVDGELGMDELNWRFGTYERMYGIKAPKRLMKTSLKGKGLSLRNETGQKKVDQLLEYATTNIAPDESKGGLLVIDNYASLVSLVDDNDAWEPTYKWLSRLAEEDWSVLLVHHEGKGGLPRGALTKIDLSHTVIRLVGKIEDPLEKPDTVEFVVKTTKGEPEAKRIRPHLSLKYLAKKPKWELVTGPKMSKQEVQNLCYECFKKGMGNAEILKKYPELTENQVKYARKKFSAEQKEVAETGGVSNR
jgi:hypothetical protein